MTKKQAKEITEFSAAWMAKQKLEETLERNKLELFALIAATPRNGVDDEGYFRPAIDISTDKALELWKSIIETNSELTLINQALESYLDAKNIQ